MRLAEYKKIGEREETYKEMIPPKYDEEGNIITEAYEEEKTRIIPVMGVVYRDMTDVEIAEFEQTQREYENSPEYKHQRINALKEELATFDYIGVKLAMGVATKEEYAEKIAYTEELRRQIRELEEELQQNIHN